MAGLADDNQDDVLEQAVQRFIDALLSGEKPDLEAFAGQYPQCEAQLKKRLQSVEQVDELLTGLTRAEESDFEDTGALDDLIDAQIGAFQITEVIGRGGMGIVYKGRDTRLDRVVAIKAMPGHLLDDSDARRRFQREAKLLASLSHPNIGAIHDILEQGEGRTYLVLEYIPGETLTERLAREPLGWKEALSIGRQISEAVWAAHEAGVVHRDLKPGNIKITPDGRVKVLDFGIAKTLAEEGQTAETVTKPGRLIGTPAYMSPEQARAQEVDSRSDIWSFGCVLYEMLTGNVPFEGQTTSDTLANVLHKEPNWQALPLAVPPNIQVLLRRCLEKDPRSRLQNIGDAVIEIRETLSLPTTTPPGTSPSISPTAHIAVRARARRIVMAIATTAVVALSAVAVWFVLEQRSGPASKEIRLVVLPFENLGPADDEYFATGITDAITARLAAIHGLGVISRQSAMQYKKTEKTARQIADELQVDYILEGTVQRERPSDPNSRVRIIPQLIKASNDTHVWAPPQPYDNEMSEVFRVQSDLAEQVAQALHVTLIERERRALWSRPTENMEAYDYYLRGKEYWHRGYAKQNWTVAIQMFERAVELDPKFALAYAHLSRCHAALYWDRHDPTAERLELAKRAADRALELAPDLPEAHWALGHYYYRAHLDYDRALEQFAIAQKDLPNDSDLLTGIHYVQRRQGKFEEALANIKRASELDPLSNIIAFDLASMFTWMRNYPEALRCLDKAISLAPDLPEAYGRKASLYLRWEGSTKNARAVVEEALKRVASPEQFRISWQIAFAVYEGDYPKALDALSLKAEDIDDLDDFVPRAMRYASIYTYMNEKERAKERYDEGRKDLLARVQQQPDDSRFHSALGIAYAGLGRKDDAIREGRMGVNLLPTTKDAIRGYSRAVDLARIYVMVGESDLAMDQIEFLLKIPGDLSIPLLRLSPAWAPLREHPRFKKLLETTE